MYDSIKTIHFFFIFSSLGFFLLRSIWMLQGSTWLNKAFVKRAPHVIDTLLLCSGIGLIIVSLSILIHLVVNGPEGHGLVITPV